MAITNGVIITDCSDDNARVRQELRFASLFGVQPAFLGVGPGAVLGAEAGEPDIEAAGNLVDQLDAAMHLPTAMAKSQTVMLVNVAPRGEDIKQRWPNGTPFCYFKVGDVLVASTFEGRTLGVARDMGLVKEVQLMDVPTVTAAAVTWGELTPEEAERINRTQFRSLEFLPLAARWLTNGRDVPAETRNLEHIPSLKGLVWWVDSFGNAKTTLLPGDIGFEEGKKVRLFNGEDATCYRHLADVPQGATALIVGSSGFGDDRFIELVVQRQSAARKYRLRVGSHVLQQPTEA